MTNLYQENILDHYKNPRNFGKLKNADRKLTGANLSCGDELTWYLKIKDGQITEASFTSQACAICTASASMLSEKLVGKSIAKISTMTPEQVTKKLGIKLSPVRLKCALLPLEALKDQGRE